MKKVLFFICLILLPLEAYSFGEKPFEDPKVEKKEELKKIEPKKNEKIMSDAEKEKKAREILRKGTQDKQSLYRKNADMEKSRSEARGCLRFLNVSSKKKSLLMNLGIYREELYKSRFRNSCDFGIQFNYQIIFIDKDNFDFQKVNHYSAEIGKNMVDEVTKAVIFSPITDFNKIKQVQIKILDEKILRPRVPKELVQ